MFAAPAVSPSGARAAFEFRGEIVTVPAEKGDPRNLTNSPGVYERDPAWSPDGKTIAYFSDASGEYELHVAPQNGHGEVKKVKLTGAGYYQNLVWSHDSKKVSYLDNSQTLYWLDLDSGKATKVVTAEHGRLRGQNPSCWSHDSKWLTYAADNAAQISRVYVYSLAQNKSFPVTDGLSEAVEPVFDGSGKYLYFLSSTDTGMSKHGFMQSSADSQRPHFSLDLAVLRKDLPSPFLRESDEEKEAKKDAAAVQGLPPGVDIPDEMKERMAAARKPKEPVKVDVDGLDQRILAFPLPGGNYFNLQAGTPGYVYYLSRGETAAAPGGRAPAARRALLCTATTWRNARMKPCKHRCCPTN